MKIVIISDTHNLTPELPSGDLLIHAGDFTMRGEMDEVKQFSKWLSSIQDQFRYIILTPGNHDFWFDGNNSDVYPRTNVFVNQCIIIEGIKFWLSPYSNQFASWAFMGEENELSKIWNKIPTDTDVVVTHGPPKGILDLSLFEYKDMTKHAGSQSLLYRILKIKPKVHIFGHIHEAYGEKYRKGIHFINASITNESYQAVNQPIVINL